MPTEKVTEKDASSSKAMILQTHTLEIAVDQDEHKLSWLPGFFRLDTSQQEDP
jgi:hypothetical protein